MAIRKLIQTETAESRDSRCTEAAELYRGLPQEVMRFARLQTEAGLLKLRREGRARPTGEPPRWELV